MSETRLRGQRKTGKLRCVCYLNARAAGRAAKGQHAGYICPIHERKEYEAACRKEESGGFERLASGRPFSVSRERRCEKCGLWVSENTISHQPGFGNYCEGKGRGRVKVTAWVARAVRSGWTTFEFVKASAAERREALVLETEAERDAAEVLEEQERNYNADVGRSLRRD